MKYIQLKGFFVTSIIYIISINNILAAYPPNYEVALKLFKEKKYEESLTKIREVFDSYRKSLEFRLLAASNYIELNNLENAMAHLKYAKQDHPNSYEVNILMSEIFNRLNQYENSIKILNQASQNIIDINQKKIIFFQLAKTYYLLKNYNLARKNLETLIAQYPDFDSAIYLDGLIYLNQNNLEFAEIRFRSLLSLKKLDLEIQKKTYNNLGVIYLKNSLKYPKESSEFKENSKIAKQYFDMSLKLDPQYTIAKKNIEEY